MKFIFIIIIFLFIFIILSLYKINESFTNNRCSHLSELECKKKGQKCGWSVLDNGKSTCIPGDNYGPLMNYKTDNWWYKNKCIFGNECRSGDVYRLRDSNYKARTWHPSVDVECTFEEPKYVKEFIFDNNKIYENIYIRLDNGQKGNQVLSQEYTPNTIYRHDGPLLTQSCTS